MVAASTISDHALELEWITLAQKKSAVGLPAFEDDLPI